MREEGPEREIVVLALPEEDLAREATWCFRESGWGMNGWGRSGGSGAGLAGLVGTTLASRDAEEVEYGRRSCLERRERGQGAGGRTGSPGIPA